MSEVESLKTVVRDLVKALEIALEEADRGKHFARELSRQTIEENLEPVRAILNVYKDI